jgi:hypothetical protein
MSPRLYPGKGANLLGALVTDHDARRQRPPAVERAYARTSIGANSAPLIIDPEKNPGGYCGLGGTGVACPVGLASGPAAH